VWQKKACSAEGFGGWGVEKRGVRGAGKAPSSSKGVLWGGMQGQGGGQTGKKSQIPQAALAVTGKSRGSQEKKISKELRKG